MRGIPPKTVFRRTVALGILMRRWRWSIELAALALLAAGPAAHAQSTPDLQSVVLAVGQEPPPPGRFQPPVQDNGNAFVRFFRNGEWYYSWGYNKEYWAPSDTHVSQPSLGNNFTIHDVQGHDSFSWPALVNGDLFGPQYNIRIGRFINDERTLGVEFSLDHTKYNNALGQTANVTGLVGGVPTNENLKLDSNTFSEMLHNGANHVMVNAVYRYPLIGQTNETLSVSALGKAGLGIMLPHTTDTILGNTNNVGSKTLSNAVGLTTGWWQLNGWTAGVEAGIRIVLWKPVYLEITDKVAYAYLGDLPAFMGTIQQSLLMNEIIVSIGFTYDGPR
jgi:hypothetical protein